MKYSRFQGQSFIGLRDIDLVITKPIVLICGLNGHGKSSFAEGIVATATGLPLRRKVKKDFGKLLPRDGTATKGLIAVESTMGTASFSLPDGRWNESLLPEYKARAQYLRYVIGAQHLSAMDETARRNFLQALMNVSATSEDIQARLTARGVHAACIKAVLPSLPVFAAAAGIASAKATETKGLWRGVTGKTAYPPKAAEEWKAEIPAYDEAGHAKTVGDHARQRAQIDTWNQERGGLVQQKTDQQAAQTQLAELMRQQAALVIPDDEHLQQERAAAEGQLESCMQALEKLPGGTGDAPAPRAKAAPAAAVVQATAEAQEALDLLVPIWQAIQATTGIYHKTGAETLFMQWYEFGFLDPLEAFIAKHQPPPAEDEPVDLDTAQEAHQRREAAVTAVRLADEALQAVERRIKAAQGVVQQAADLRRRIAELQGRAYIAGLDTRITEIDAKLTDARSKLQTLAAAVTACEEAKKAVDKAGEKTTEALKYHKQVVAWTKCAEALGPDGIPAELLTETLGPINKTMHSIAEWSGWPEVRIAPDMTITFGALEYVDISDSQKWRTNITLATAITIQCGLNFLLCDGLDILDSEGRKQLFRFVTMAVRAGALDQAILLGTFKQIPGPLPAEWQTAWLTNGRIGEPPQTAKPAQRQVEGATA